MSSAASRLGGKAWGLKVFTCCIAGMQEATLALTEAMHIAQQSGDNMALAHSLAMLSHLVDSASLSAAPVLSSGPPSRRAEAKHIHLLRLLRK